MTVEGLSGARDFPCLKLNLKDSSPTPSLTTQATLPFFGPRACRCGERSEPPYWAIRSHTCCEADVASFAIQSPDQAALFQCAPFKSFVHFYLTPFTQICLSMGSFARIDSVSFQLFRFCVFFSWQVAGLSGIWFGNRCRDGGGDVSVGRDESSAPLARSPKEAHGLFSVTVFAAFTQGFCMTWYLTRAFRSSTFPF